MMNRKQIETDVFILGGGPAGLAAGIAARRKGFNVLIADCARPPIDKACGEGLMPDGLATLQRLGIMVSNQAGSPFAGIRFISKGSKATAHFPQGFGLGIRRTKLHEILMQSAYQAGASILWGTHAEMSPDGTLSVGGAPVHCRWIVGADGQKSTVRLWAGIQNNPGRLVRFGYRCHFQTQPWTDCVEVYWGPGCQVFVTPVGLSEVCVVVLARDPRLRFDKALSLFPRLHQRLSRASRRDPLRGALSIQRTMRTVATGKFILVGDASGSVDAVTGEGLCLSFRQAECLADALMKNDLEVYRQGHRRIRKVPAVMARLMLLMDRFPLLGETVVRSFERYPALFSACLAKHVETEATDSTFQDVAGMQWEGPDASNY